jgi:hypothetical protein
MSGRQATWPGITGQRGSRVILELRCEAGGAACVGWEDRASCPFVGRASFGARWVPVPPEAIVRAVRSFSAGGTGRMRLITNQERERKRPAWTAASVTVTRSTG